MSSVLGLPCVPDTQTFSNLKNTFPSP